MITFVIDAAPYGKGRPRFTRDGHAYTPEKTANYERLVQWAYQSQTHGARIDGPIEAIIFAEFAPNRSDRQAVRDAKLSGEMLPQKKPDCDNIAKTILDALNGLAYDDDAQVVYLSVYKLYSRVDRVTVRLSEAKSYRGEIEP